MYMKTPLPNEYPPYFEVYISAVKDKDILTFMVDQPNELEVLAATIPADKENYTYADKKWTIKEVFSHITDTERIMAYRALRFARKDKTPIPGFDEDYFVANSDLSKLSIKELVEEFKLVRQANMALFKQFDEEVLNQTGNSNGKIISVRGIIYMIAGHATHHLNILKERYLKNMN